MLIHNKNKRFFEVKFQNLGVTLYVGTKNMLQSMSEKQGLRMSTAESKNDIPKFIEFFQAGKANTTDMDTYVLSGRF